ncbi:protein kinase domain-containing protein [Priestia megaterium]|uniref:protein kinase domain-containing protein n=1 Tax=Priestia megaterium TaxID=1404 RepID=UPI001596A2B2|nr:protein kinase [Priestia megaterium]
MSLPSEFYPYLALMIIGDDHREQYENKEPFLRRIRHVFEYRSGTEIYSFLADFEWFISVANEDANFSSGRRWAVEEFLHRLSNEQIKQIILKLKDDSNLYEYDPLFDEIDYSSPKVKDVKKCKNECDKLLKRFFKDGKKRIGEGAFAEVYQTSSNLAFKKVISNKKDEVSRFKREFKLMYDNRDIKGVLKVFEFFEGENQFSMELAQSNLRDFLTQQSLNVKQKIKLIYKLIDIIDELHKREIIHRDLHPGNILFVNNKMKVADFGFAKKLDEVHSHKTMQTAAIGVYAFTSPEQQLNLKNATKKSDIFAIGKIINYVFTEDPNNSNHDLGSICSRATANDPESRFDECLEMKKSIQDIENFVNNKEIKKYYEVEMKSDDYIRVKNIISNLSGKDICRFLLERLTSPETIIHSLSSNINLETSVIDKVCASYQEVCGRKYENYDVFGDFAFLCIKTNIDYANMVKLASVLNYVAYSVGRFRAQRQIQEMINKGIDPTIEELLV